MELWGILFVAIAIIVTRIAVTICQGYTYIYEDYKIARIIINTLLILFMILLGGIPIGHFLGTRFVSFFLTPMTIEDLIVRIVVWVVTVLISIAVYVGYHFILGLYHFSERYRWLQNIFRIVYVVSIIGWSIIVYQYHSNIETTTQTILQSTEKRNLLSFCNIPVQNISGRIYIDTTDNLPYWYLDENGEGAFDSSPATNSNIVFLEDNQSPYVEIMVYSTQTIEKNHNNGTEKTTTDHTWAEYTFYLPKTIMQYNLK